MPLSRIDSLTFLGLDASTVHVEVDTQQVDKGNLVIVGLPDAAVRESKERVLAAVKNSGFQVQNLYITVNLAPGGVRKEGAYYDLPIALGILCAVEQLLDSVYSNYMIAGELGLGGETRPIPGVLAMAIYAKELGKKGIIVPYHNAQEGCYVSGIDVIPVETLSQAFAFLKGQLHINPIKQSIVDCLFQAAEPIIDFSHVKGQRQAKRALEIAAAGGHNLIMSGPPGSGKTMLARAFSGILPPLTPEESLEITKIYSIAGLLKDKEHLITQRPFRAPHHTISYAGLIGGGSVPQPGEVSLAHRGVLFLDELTEFSRTTLEVLRQPLEDRHVTVSRARAKYIFPSDFLCIAAMNPCPCGFLGHPDKVCKDSSLQIERYRSKISGPLLDRIDIHLEIPPLKYREINSLEISEQLETSKVISSRVQNAREIQRRRFASSMINGQMSGAQIKMYCKLDVESQQLLSYAMDELSVSARAHDRILRVARTIADLSHSENIVKDHLLEALSLRSEWGSSKQ